MIHQLPLTTAAKHCCRSTQHNRNSNSNSALKLTGTVICPARGCIAARLCSSNGKVLTLDNINSNFARVKYAIRGDIISIAAKIEKELRNGVKKPFDKIIWANIGDSHGMGQKPITFVRQLLLLTIDPKLMCSPDYPEDVKARARLFLANCSGGSLGAYTESIGMELVRQQVCEYCTKRDCGVPCEPDNIYTSDGATRCIRTILRLLSKVGSSKVGIMVPIPQYPLYSATLTEYGMHKVDYYLDEEQMWGLNCRELERVHDEAKDKCIIRALLVINPGNPTGQVLSRKNIEEIICFAYQKKLLLLVDEVYQGNVYDPQSEFHSFKKVMYNMGGPHDKQELISFNSVSKGCFGECGFRGGYMEVFNMCSDVQKVLNNCLLVNSNTAGQVVLSALVNPPKPGEPSYDLYNEEMCAVKCSLAERAKLMYKTLSGFEGYSVNPTQGAMYVFPKIALPDKAIEAAKAKNMEPDRFYVYHLLLATGICVVPGSGFGQIPGTYHFRSTILPQMDELKLMMEKLNVFHKDFLKKYK